MPISASEFNTFYFITRLTRELFPGHRVYIAREKDMIGEVLNYHAGVAKYEGDVIKSIALDTEIADERIDALEKLLGDLEDVAEERFKEFITDTRDDDAGSDTKMSSSEEEDEGRQGKGRAPVRKDAEETPRRRKRQSNKEGRDEVDNGRDWEQESDSALSSDKKHVPCRTIIIR